MAVISIYASGVSTTGIEILNDAAKQTFGECSVEELGRDNLRFKVRSGMRDTSVALIILDNTSMEECRDIEDGLYQNAQKFYHYVGDRELAEHLNKLYDLSLVVDDIPISDSRSIDNNEELAELVEQYVSQLSEKDGIIKTLNFRIRELESIADGVGYQQNEEELNELKDENLILKNKIADLERELGTKGDEIEAAQSSNIELQEELKDTETRLSKVESEYSALSKELADERVSSSQKSGVIRDKDRQILELTERVGQVDRLNAMVGERNLKISHLDDEIKSLKGQINSLNIENSSKDAEIEHLKSDIALKGQIDEQVSKYKDLLSEAEKGKSELEVRYSELESKYSDLIEKNDQLTSELKESEDDYYALRKKYDDSEGFLSQLNSEKIQLLERIRVLERSSNIDKDAEKVMTELSELRRKYAELQANVFNVIATKSLPYSGVKVPIIKSVLPRFKNIRFQFSGNSESRKGTYKCIYNELITHPNDKFLIVDVTSETAVDYVFQMKSIIDGMQWFSTGGGVQKYLSPTCIPNVKVLMPRIGYVNDSYYLTVNWERRLNELENSGYKVIIYCGDISNLVGRVLFESFAELGNTAIYVHGNVLGSRSVIANSNGLSAIKSSIIAYYDFDECVSKFYSIMNKKCQCSIISYANSNRKVVDS